MPRVINQLIEDTRTHEAHSMRLIKAYAARVKRKFFADDSLGG